MTQRANHDAETERVSHGGVVLMWARHDDSSWSHPKLVAVGLAGHGLWARGLAWSSQHLTDGRIPKAVIPMLAGGDPEADAIVARLLDARLWHDRDDHFEIHDFLDYAPDRNTVLLQREKDAARKRGRKNGRPKQAELLADSDSGASGRNPGGIQASRTRTRTVGNHLLSEPPSARPDGPRDQVQARALEALRRIAVATGKRWREPHRYLTARLRDGATVDQVVLVVEHRHAEWDGDPKMRQYVRQPTLFQAGKWEGYLEAAERWDQEGRPAPGRRAGAMAPGWGAETYETGDAA